jgi:hypothetical protein
MLQVTYDSSVTSSHLPAVVSLTWRIRQVPILQRSLRLPHQHPRILQRPRQDRLGEGPTPLLSHVSARSPSRPDGTSLGETPAQDL